MLYAKLILVLWFLLLTKLEISFRILQLNPYVSSFANNNSCDKELKALDKSMIKLNKFINSWCIGEILSCIGEMSSCIVKKKKSEISETNSITNSSVVLAKNCYNYQHIFHRSFQCRNDFLLFNALIHHVWVWWFTRNITMFAMEVLLVYHRINEPIELNKNWIGLYYLIMP